MFQMDLKARFHNKAFLMALASAILILIKSLGFGDHIPSNIDSILNGLITIGILLGVITDTSTPGISDKVVSDATVKAVNSQEQVKTEASTVSINNAVLENSLDAKTLVEELNRLREEKSVTITSQGLETVGELKINDNSINSSVQPTENLNASAKVNVDIPVEG